MTSLKKPLIAIASAVALVTTALVASPASAATVAISGGDYAAGSTNGSTSALAVTLPVPADNTVDAADVLTISVSAAVAGSTITASATNARIVTALHTSSAPVTSVSGAGTASVATGTGTTATLYVFTTTTIGGSVAVTADGNTTVYYVKGSAGSAYNLNVVAPKFVNLGGTATITATTTDVFGNAVTNASISNTVIRGTVGAFTYDATDKVYKATFTAPSVAGDSIAESTITASAVAGLAKPVTSVLYTVSVGDLAAQVATLSATVADLEAKLKAANKKAADNRKKHNKLAMKWNKKFPKAKVKLLKK